MRWPPPAAAAVAQTLVTVPRPPAGRRGPAPQIPRAHLVVGVAAGLGRRVERVPTVRCGPAAAVAAGPLWPSSGRWMARRRLLLAVVGRRRRRPRPAAPPPCLHGRHRRCWPSFGGAAVAGNGDRRRRAARVGWPPKWPLEAPAAGRIRGRVLWVLEGSWGGAPLVASDRQARSACFR